MILVFGLANSLSFSTGGQAHLFIALLILLSAFLRLRFFDEIKDYETDLKINPTRPLARGVLERDQVKLVIFLLIILELLLASSLGQSVFMIHSLAIGYSLLMYEEFFIGDQLRPHLTTYAVSHTFVSVLLATTVAISATGATVNELLQPANIMFLSSNWMFFNIFEFARKTYAVDEEREGVPTYSNIFGIPGAVLLTLSQVWLGLGLLKLAEVPNFIYLSTAGLIYVLISLAFVLKKNRRWAGIFRNMTGLYLLSHYALLAWVYGKDLL